MADANDDREDRRRRIEAAGLRLPPERAEEILDAARLILGMTARVRRALTYADEPAAFVRLEAQRR